MRQMGEVWESQVIGSQSLEVLNPATNVGDTRQAGERAMETFDFGWIFHRIRPCFSENHLYLPTLAGTALKLENLNRVAIQMQPLVS
jgi:hypothetical protein